jgi:phosphohistidine phosphatase
MQVYIVRHGEAIDHHDPSVTSDAMRALTERGRDEVATMARLLSVLGVHPDLILSSPLVRARQTAEIFAEMLTPGLQPQTSEQLAPGGSPDGVLQDIVQPNAPRVALLAGHMPGVGQLAGYFAFSDPLIVFPFRTAEVCRVDLSDDSPGPGNGVLRWLIPPAIAKTLLQT